jgi:hypothetical protein
MGSEEDEHEMSKMAVRPLFVVDIYIKYNYGILIGLLHNFWT